MQTKVTMTLGLGFILGLGLASCASLESRSVASDSSPRYSVEGAGAVPEETRPCSLGEDRDESGRCVRRFEGDHDGRRRH